MNVTAILSFGTGFVQEREMKTGLLIYHCKSQCTSKVQIINKCLKELQGEDFGKESSFFSVSGKHSPWWYY